MFPKNKPHRSEDYKAFVRGLPCVVSGRTPCDPHHTERGIPKGPDTRCIPLHHPYHVELHAIGVASFERKYGLDLQRSVIETLEKYIMAMEVKWRPKR